MIEVAALKRACLEFGELGEDSLKPLPHKPKKVAVIGGGISGCQTSMSIVSHSRCVYNPNEADILLKRVILDKRGQHA